MSTRLAASIVLAPSLVAADDALSYRIQLDTLRQDYDGQHCWTQARAAAIPRAGEYPIVVVTMQRLLLTGIDVYYAINELRSDDLGRTWTGPIEHSSTLGRRSAADGSEVAISNFWPQWHASSGRILGTGNTLPYKTDKGPDHDAPQAVAYSSYNPDTRAWAPWTTLEQPAGARDYYITAGCAQRLDLPGGDLLLPVSFKAKGEAFTRVKVLRCHFDGARLTLRDEGASLSVDTRRGLAEPSLTRYRGKYLMTVRHDLTGYVTSSDDGLNYGPLQTWCWDDGRELGTYNTQTHWVTHRDGLFLVYTRRGANNDHVFRHRAPLFIAEVDPKTLRIKRATERILLPDKGARYGNFGVCNVNAQETWVVDTEWMQRPPEEPIIPVENRWGAAGRVYAARIIWNRPNTEPDNLPVLPPSPLP
ncbi:MAG TPA: hypothetical protein VK985_05195 [Rariglobus sp.]|nr:hypothetical protein [Rariglobus sp.]